MCVCVCVFLYLKKMERYMNMYIHKIRYAYTKCICLVFIYIYIIIAYVSTHDHSIIPPSSAMQRQHPPYFDASHASHSKPRLGLQTQKPPDLSRLWPSSKKYMCISICICTCISFGKFTRHSKRIEMCWPSMVYLFHGVIHTYNLDTLG